MPDLGVEISSLKRQHAAIARLGSFAFRQNDLMTILLEAARVCADALDAPFCNVCRYRPEADDLLVEAGIGWQDGVVGHIVLQADKTSPPGRAFVTEQPAICYDSTKDATFRLSPFYADHGIISIADVAIKGQDRPYGVLEIDHNQQVYYSDHDTNFLTSVANVIAEAAARFMRTDDTQAALEEKDQLLRQQKVMAEELQHRVRNNMQLIYSMLSRQLNDLPDEASKRGIRSITRRVSALAQVYDSLLGTAMARTTDFGSYASSLCRNIAEIQAADVTLTCDFDRILLDLDTVTVLGIVLAELVTNSYDHAFATSGGAITVAVRAPANGEDLAVLTVRDTGRGFTPQYESKRHGLGLVRRLVEQVRGTIHLKADHGTVWDIRFPVPPVTGLAE